VPTLFSKVMEQALYRLPILGRAGKTARLERLLDAGAWTEAALTLIELELPAWSLKRLVREDGQWFCSLSRQLNLPAALDDTADARHDSLPLAVLLAFLQAQRMAEAVPATPSTTPHIRPAPEGTICCDNFA
jgi:hypothetical protein